MKYALIITAALLVGYVLLAARMKLWPWGGKVIGTVKPRGEIEKALARLGIPYPGDVMAASVTPAGVRVTSSVVVPQVALDTIDDALSSLFAAYHIAYPAWNTAVTHKDYAVMFIDPMATNQDGSPALMIIGQQSAGTCIGFPFPMSYIVLPHQELRAWVYRDYLFNSVYNEGEHFIESHNSREVFDRFTGLHDTHPHVQPQNV